MTERELGHRVHLDSGTLAPLLRRLEGLGVLRRSRPEEDERTLRLTLTEAGEALKEEALSVPCAMQGCLDLAPDELLQLKKLLDKALKGMENER